MDKETKFVTRYPFAEDKSREERLLQTVRIGGVYISRVEIEPNASVANLYYKNTNFIFFIETGRMQAKFVQVNTKEEKEIIIEPGSGIMHVPPYNAFAVKNLSKEKGIMIVFSDQPLRAGDDVEFKIY